jgi:hypothetical protein
MEPSRIASNTFLVAYAAHGKGKGCDMSITQCYNCKKYGHIALNYPKKFCNYCKQHRHIIKDCPIQPTRSNKAYHVVVTSNLQPAMSASTTNLQPAISAGIATNYIVVSQPATHFLTREMVQEMIVSAFSALGLQGIDSSSPSWILDLGASNHMTNSLHGLSNVRKYGGSSNIQIANGSALSIVAVASW